MHCKIQYHPTSTTRYLHITMYIYVCMNYVVMCRCSMYIHVRQEPDIKNLKICLEALRNITFQRYIYHILTDHCMKWAWLYSCDLPKFLSHAIPTAYLQLTGHLILHAKCKATCMYVCNYEKMVTQGGGRTNKHLCVLICC